MLQNSFKHIIIVFISAFIVLLFHSCQPTKPTLIRKAYHNLTSHYNAYFNGNESLKEGITELNKKAEDDYTRILPVFKIGTPENAQSISSYTDKAIKKAATVIQKHSFAPHNKQGKEYCKWIDDTYLLMGKAQFYKQNYSDASESFNYVIKKFNNPIKYEAMLWYVRAKNQKKDYVESQSILAMVESKVDKNMMKNKTERLLQVCYADFFVQRGLFSQAVPYLEKSIRQKEKKKVRSRLTFILAQIKQKDNKLDTASLLYKQVMKMNPPYVMAFNAKINWAKCFDATTQDSKPILKLLEKMLKDSKNREYLDQIYYTIAEIYLKKQDTVKAIENYKLSASSSMNNIKQKTYTYLTLANLFYSQTNYRDAQVYYDSAVPNLPQDYPDYKTIVSRKELLNDLVNYLKVVEFEDSMQVLAKLPEKDRVKAIDKIISAIIKEEQRKQKEEAERQRTLALYQRNQQEINQMAGGSTASWYFYNSSTKSFGYTEFTKRWGKRPLEDLWMLKDKKAVSFDFDETGGENKDSTDIKDSISKVKEKVVENPKDRNYYLKRIPLTQEATEASTKRIMEAMFNAGYLYYEGLKDYSKAVQTFQLYLKRFPDTPYEVRAYYYLYKIYNDTLFNTERKNYYKNLLLSKYPNSDYARVISNPDYFKNLQSQQSKSSVFYKETYLAFTEKKYDVVLKNSDEAFIAYKDDILIPKFELLKALVIGKTNNEEQFKTALQEVIRKYPKSEEKKHAQLLLSSVFKEDTKDSAGIITFKKNIQKPKDLFTYNDSTIHIYVIIADFNKVKIKDLENSISDFNKASFELDNLTTGSLLLDGSHQMITVSNFKSKEKGMIYLNMLNANPDVLLNINPEDYSHFIISTENYTNFFQQKKTKEYLEFFKKFYLN